MLIQPKSRQELAHALAQASADGARGLRVDLRAMDRVIEHFPEDMTATVECGLTLGRFQEQLRVKGQWLPLDPAGASDLSIGHLLDENRSGPRRCGYGLARDYVIGMTVALATGELVRSGGKVVKNVAGYDLLKAFIGAYGSLGVIVEVTFKLRPLPARELILQRSEADLAAAFATIGKIQESPLTPVIFDLLRNDSGLLLFLGFDGAAEDVEYQARIARGFGFEGESDTAYFQQFMRTHRGAGRESHLPSRLHDRARALGAAPFLAHIANGAICSPAIDPKGNWPNPAGLATSLKRAFDPGAVFPEPFAGRDAIGGL